jgi:mono/diheme cytochrome c family protein
MTRGLARPEHGLALAGTILLLVGCASAPSSGPAVASHARHSRASSDAIHGEGRDDHPPTARSLRAEAPPAEEGLHEHGLAVSEPSEQEAFESARPVFERYCASCHTTRAGKRAALRHFTMDRYPFGGHHADQVSSTIREVLGASGQPATMPKDRPGAVQGNDLRAILDWADAFDRAHAAANPKATGRFYVATKIMR